MNNIPEFVGGGEYNSPNFQLVDCPIKCHSHINRRSLQSEGGARYRQIKRVSENTYKGLTLSNFISDCKNYAI